MTVTSYQPRHPELVSGSILPLYYPAGVARWMLKRVQQDVVVAAEPML